MKKRNYTPLIWIVTIVAVAIVLSVNYIVPSSDDNMLFGMDVSILPLINAILNGIAGVLLVISLIMIKRKNIQAHRNFIFAAFITTFLFLITYLTYHTVAGSTTFGGTGFVKYVYFFILITHIILAAAVIPLSLFTVTKGLNMDIPAHKKIARWTMPIWLYVSVTGVVVYLMISPYY